MGFDRVGVIELVRDFYRAHQAEADTQFLVTGNLDDALRLAMQRGPDGRWSSITLIAAALDVESQQGRRRRVRDIHEVIYRHALQRRTAAAWTASSADGVALSAYHGDGLAQSLRKACDRGMGWLLLAHRTAIIVPSPVVRTAEGRPLVPHDDTGRMAVIWPDSHGYYFLQGSEFTTRLYFQVINHELLIQDIALLGGADQRAIALQYLTFEQLVLDSDAQLMDRGVRGTRLYRLELPPLLARDRKRGHGDFDYFIHMRDASHPEREFIEWVDPEIGRQRNAELCQAHSFGISLHDWLSIEQEG